MGSWFVDIFVEYTFRVVSHSPRPVSLMRLRILVSARLLSEEGLAATTKIFSTTIGEELVACSGKVCVSLSALWM
jgi:hypothetical protein